MSNIISNPNQHFYYLSENYNFSFNYIQTECNLLKNSNMIKHHIIAQNNIDRNLDGELLLLNATDKLCLCLKGCGTINLHVNVVYFISSTLILPTTNMHNRQPCFDYYFHKNEILFEDKSSNIANFSIEQRKELFCLPIIRCSIEKKILQQNSWNLTLQEI